MTHALDRYGSKGGKSYQELDFQVSLISEILRHNLQPEAASATDDDDYHYKNGERWRHFYWDPPETNSRFLVEISGCSLSRRMLDLAVEVVKGTLDSSGKTMVQALCSRAELATPSDVRETLLLLKIFSSPYTLRSGTEDDSHLRVHRRRWDRVRKAISELGPGAVTEMVGASGDPAVEDLKIIYQNLVFGAAIREDLHTLLKGYRKFQGGVEKASISRCSST